MHKRKICIAVLLTFALLAAGACFPNIVSHILDWQHNGVPSYNPIMSIQLEIKRDVPALGRLAMMSRMDGYIELAESKASMTKEEVMTAVSNGLAPYIDTQLMDAQLMEYSESDVQLHPCLIQVPNMPDLQGVVWFVTVSADPNAFSYLGMAIDDETGDILQINYTCEVEMNTISGVEALNQFADIFFSSLGIEDYWYFAETNLEYEYTAEDVNAMRYSLGVGDKVYGEVNIDLYVHEHGFYVEFPEM